MVVKGYRPKKKTYRLVFDDPEYEGLEVVMRSVSIGSLLAMARLADQARSGDLDAAGIEGFFHRFAKCLESWNVEDDDGKPVPADFGGVSGQDAGFIMAVFEAWFAAVTAVDPTSNGASPSGGTSLEAQLAAASRSGSRGS